MRTHIIGLILLAPCGACAASADDVTFEGLVADHESGLEQEPTDCGSVAIGNDCRVDLSEAERCLLDAAAQCEPARLEEDSFTVEGGRIPTVSFVAPGPEGGCEITRFTDHHLDEYKGDYGDIVKSECTAVGEQAFDEAVGACATLAWEGCATAEEWNL